MSDPPRRWVLLPGLDGRGRLFRGFLECLRDDDVVVVEYPDEAGWSLDDYASHAAQAIGDAPRCLVVAESFSGPVALRLQRRDPRVVGVVLVASFVRCPNLLLRMLPSAALAAVIGKGANRMSLRAFCLGLDASAEQIGELAEAVGRLPPAVMRARFALLRTLDERKTLRSMDVPALHLRARRDRLVCATLAGDGARSGSFRETPIDGPHFLLQARPRACRQAIDDWLGQVFAGSE